MNEQVNGKISDPSTLEKDAVRGKKGIIVSDKSITVICKVDKNGLVTAEPIAEFNLKINHFGFANVLASGSYAADNERYAMVICDPEGYAITKSGHETDEGYRFFHLSTFVRIVIDFFIRDFKRVAEWHVTHFYFQGSTKTANTILAIEERYSLEMPSELGRRFLMKHCEEEIPQREKLTSMIRAYVEGNSQIPTNWKEKLSRLAEVMAVTYARAWEVEAYLPTKEVQAATQPTTTAAAPAEPSNVLKFPAPVGQEVFKPEDAPQTDEKAAAAVGGGESNPDPNHVAENQAQLGSEIKKTRNRRKGGSKKDK